MNLDCLKRLSRVKQTHKVAKYALCMQKGAQSVKRLAETAAKNSKIARKALLVYEQVVNLPEKH